MLASGSKEVNCKSITADFARVNATWGDYDQTACEKSHPCRQFRCEWSEPWEQRKKQLTESEKVGIGLGAGLGGIALLIVAFYVFRHRRNKKMDERVQRQIEVDDVTVVGDADSTRGPVGDVNSTRGRQSGSNRRISKDTVVVTETQR